MDSEKKYKYFEELPATTQSLKLYIGYAKKQIKYYTNQITRLDNLRAEAQRRVKAKEKELTNG